MKTAIRLLLLTCLSLLVGCSHNHPSDPQLLARFQAHRGDLDLLIRMFKADKGLGRVGTNFTRPDDPARVGVSAERIGEYRRLCSAVGAESCIEGYDATFDRLYGAVTEGRTEAKEPIWIHISSLGLSITGSGKGFIYSETPPTPPFVLVPDLDDVTVTESGAWLRHIEGPWYLYYEYEF